MFSLAKITRDARTVGKFAAIGLVIILFLFFSYRGIIFINSILNPPQVAPPDMKFGDLVSTLPVQASKPSYLYEIDTITGSLPTFPSRLRVYKTVTPEPDLLGVQKARDAVSQLDYIVNQEQVIQANEYRWPNAVGGSITYNTLYKTFDFTSGIGLEEQEYRFNPNDRTIMSQTLQFIRQLGSDTTDIDPENLTPKFFRSSGTTLVPESDISKAYIAKLDLYQKDVAVDPFILRTDTSQTIESLPIFYEDAETPNQSFIVKAGSRNVQFVSGTYNYFPVDTTEYGMYPLKSSAQAYDDLQSGDAYILTTNTTTGTVDITEMNLGYFIPKTPVEYVMPIYIFKGKDFLAYVNAIGEYVPEYQ